MTDRIIKNLPTLIALTYCYEAEKEQLLKVLSSRTVNAIADCIKNIQSRKVPVTSAQKKKINNKRDVIRQLINRKIPAKKRKQLLVQQGGAAFLAPLLAPVIGSVLGPMMKAFGL